MNKVVLCGRLTKDPELRQTSDGSKVATYTLAVDRRSKDQGADFIHCKVFGKSADFVESYLKQGMKILILGRIQTGSYTNKEGKTVYTTEVIVDDHEFAGAKPEKAVKVSRKEDGFYEVSEEGLPFN